MEKIASEITQRYGKQKAYCHLYPREEERAVEILNKIGTGESHQPKPL